jgi:hypothetical protein
MAQRKRRVPVRRDVTPEALRAFVRAKELEAEGATESDGGRSEYAACRRTLWHLYDRPPWKAHPLDVTEAELDAPPPNPDWDAAGALEIRRALEVAAS